MDVNVSLIHIIYKAGVRKALECESTSCPCAWPRVQALLERLREFVDLETASWWFRFALDHAGVCVCVYVCVCACVYVLTKESEGVAQYNTVHAKDMHVPVFSLCDKINNVLLCM